MESILNDEASIMQLEERMLWIYRLCLDVVYVSYECTMFKLCRMDASIQRSQERRIEAALDLYTLSLSA
jgi:hypothetical protein